MLLRMICQAKLWKFSSVFHEQPDISFPGKLKYVILFYLFSCFNVVIGPKGGRIRWGI